jgi:hypothetical protein
LERRFRHWKARQEPKWEMLFPQDHPSGQHAQRDFTASKGVGATVVAGVNLGVRGSNPSWPAKATV